MKRLLITTIVGMLYASGVLAQAPTADSSKKKTDTAQIGGTKILISYGSHNDSDEIFSYSHHSSKTNYPKGYIGLTLARLDLGLATLIDNGSFTLSPKNQFLSYRQWKTINDGFDLFQMGIKLNSNFKIYMAGGFDWTLIRLVQNINIQKDGDGLTYLPATVDYSKNRFSASYLRIPLAFDFRTNPDSHGGRFHFVVGPEGSFLLGGMVKQISSEYGKQKFYDDYHFTKFRYGGVFRVGYRDFGVYAKYYFSDMFENSPDQEGLKNFSFGFMLGF